MNSHPRGRFVRALPFIAIGLLGVLVAGVLFVVFSAATPRDAAAEMSAAGIQVVIFNPTATPATAAQPVVVIHPPTQAQPTAVPTTIPTAIPTAVPTSVPTAVPTAIPTAVPTAVPTRVPTRAAPKPTSTVVVIAAAAQATAPATQVKPAVTDFDTSLQAAEAKIAPLPALECPNPQGQIVTNTIKSKIAALPITVHVYLPPCYNGREFSYPTLYLIHGTAYEQGGWIANGLPRVADIQMSLGTLPPFIIVMPGADMRAGSASVYSWTNWGEQSYEGFFLNELVPFIEDKYSTWESKEGRAIGGISRGGYWSIEIGFANADKFSTVGGHSPSIGQMLVNMPANFEMIDTAKSVGLLHTQRIWLDAGDADWARFDAKSLAEDLDNEGVRYSLDIGRGGHEDSYWASRLPEYLKFYSSNWPRTARAKQALGAARP
jgi:enterochelin esterase-like enzyme